MKEINIALASVINNDYIGTCDMCGVCCTEVSINSRLPDGTQFSKPAGVKYTYLDDDNMCEVWGNEELQPQVCRTIKPTNSLCRFDLRDVENGREKHREYLHQLETLTTPVFPQQDNS